MFQAGPARPRLSPLCIMTDPATPIPQGAAAGADSLATLLGQGAARPWWRRPLPWLAALLLAAAAGGAAWWAAQDTAAQAGPPFVTEPLKRATVTQTVTANGTLAPTRLVAIGSELSGTVAQVLVDVNDRVRRGQVLVQLDTAKLRDQIARSRAGLASAQAKLASARATQAEAQASLARLEEVARLSAGRVPAQSELDTARAALQRAQADVQAAEASVADARAALSTDETNLAKAAIRSPIDGVVLSRAVEPGNAVAASLQAVTLFTIAEDLRKMVLNVAIDEADVGAVQAGQGARFTVAAFAGRQFPASITRVAYGSTITDNVVTYTAQMAVANADLSLRPGMTATATVTAQRHENVLTVPSSALRFTPVLPAEAPASAAGTAPKAESPSVLSRLMPRPPRTTPTRRDGSAAAGSAAGPGPRRIWVLEQGRPRAVPVQVGLSEGGRTEVSGPGLAEGMAVIVDQRSGAAR